MNRIKELRKKRSLSQRQFVTNFNIFLSTNEQRYKNQRGVKEITFGTASRWENELNKPTEHMWQALADFFGVSVPYLQGAYSKEEIGKLVQDNYKLTINSGNIHTVPFLILTNLYNETIDNYFISLGVIPYEVKATQSLLKPDQINSVDFWLENLKPIYNNVAMKWLLTKPNLNATDEDILSAVNGAMSEFINASATAYTSLDAYNYDYEIEQVVKNHYMQKRFKFLEEHEYWDHEEIDEGRWEEFPVYDFKHPHPLDGKKYYIEDGKHFYFDENDKRHYID
jgi:transcriptional regulator with XRE-family HTH domain